MARSKRQVGEAELVLELEKLRAENAKLRKQVSKFRKYASKLPEVTKEDEEDEPKTLAGKKATCTECRGPLKIFTTPSNTRFLICNQCGTRRREDPK